MARYQLSASAAMACAGLLCLGHASSGMLVFGISLTAVSSCCHLMGKGHGQHADDCVTVLHRGNERTFVFVTLYFFATNIVTFLIEIDLVPGSCHSDEEKKAADGLESKDVGMLDNVSAVILPRHFLAGVDKRC